jgi:2-polyprenyl-3-methyl-5-hydroxy-6-metoxy-1,4-benzoquinol methylase
MYSGTYDGIYPEVVYVLHELIRPEDTYHMSHARRMARTLHILLDQKPKGRLLEIGTSGIIPLALKELLPDLEVSVTNFDDQMSVEHSYNVTINKHHGVFDGYRVDLEYDQIPIQDEAFDWVLCCEVIEHMEIDPMFMMSEVNRVTKTGGGLLLTTPNIVSSQALTKMVYGFEPHFYMQYHPDRQYHRHNYEYSIHSVMQVLKASGYDGKIWTEDNFENGLDEVPRRLRQAGFNIDHIGDNIITVAKKNTGVVDRHPSMMYDVRGTTHV